VRGSEVLYKLKYAKWLPEIHLGGLGIAVSSPSVSQGQSMTIPGVGLSLSPIQRFWGFKESINLWP